MQNNLIAQNDFTDAHCVFITDLSRAVRMVSNNLEVIFGAKDINSRHLFSTDSYAKIVGLQRGEDVADRLDCEMPCEGTARFADSFVQEDLSLLHGGSTSKKITTLNIHQYVDGLKARIFNKKLLVCDKSQEILGTIYSGHDVELGNFLNIIPNYVLEFGAGSILQQVGIDCSKLDVKLTEYEHEVCFFLILNWEFKKIAAFMDKYRPRDVPRTTDSIIKCKNNICRKFGIDYPNKNILKDLLINHGFHRTIPPKLLNILIGSKII